MQGLILLFFYGSFYNYICKGINLYPDKDILDVLKPDMQVLDAIHDSPITVCCNFLLIRGVTFEVI